ncbi:MAG: NUDIX domain-containing protein [Bacteroidetes bacterium]|nr:NUDIX domain-containing protein [Bacteroidota bacterium]
MLQNYKIFSGQIEIIITSVKPEKLRKKEVVFIIDLLNQIMQILPLIRKGGKKNRIHIIHKKPELAFNYFSACYRNIIAAGGIVRNRNGEILLIKKNDKWDLPKGQIKRGEKKRDAAMREISEECGVKQLEIVKKIEKTYHIGRKKGKRFFKTTHWYEMNCWDENNLQPEIAEGISEVKWVRLSQLPFYSENTYANLKKMLDQYSKNGLI